MPCEGCQVQFTVFRRKRSCSDCKRFYCNNCLVVSKRALCERCAIFAKRPLLKTDLLHLKSKDLIFFLQSKHISTAGCVEKDELVGLVLHHVQQTGEANWNADFHSALPDQDASNSFNSLKQTCQNFFSNITENLSDSFNTFDSKATSKPQADFSNRSQTQAQTRANSNEAEHIIDQPRVTTREIPTYASFQNGSAAQSQAQSQSHTHSQPQSPTEPTSIATTTDTSNSLNKPAEQSVQGNQNSGAERAANMTLNAPNDNRSSQMASPVVSISSSTSQAQGTDDFQDRSTTTAHTPSLSSDENKYDTKSDCECSDDEIIATFSDRVSLRTASNVKDDSSKCSLAATTATTSTTSTTASGSAKLGSLSSKVDGTNGEEEESSQSSFEELGAIGGISDDSKGATDTNSSNMEQWQILDNQRDSAIVSDAAGLTQNDEEKNTVDKENTVKDEEKEQEKLNDTINADTAVACDNLEVALITHQPEITTPTTIIIPNTLPQRPKRVTRRRSDGYLNRRRRPLSDDESPTSSSFVPHINSNLTLHEQDEDDFQMRDDMNGPQKRRSNCKRCGKNKMNIKRHVEKMRLHLESSQMSEADIKRELQEFLAFLENRAKSIDCSDSEQSNAVTSQQRCGPTEMTPLPSYHELSMDENDMVIDDDDGIHVYATSSDYAVGGVGGNSEARRFINLENFDSLKELEALSVKQLKEVLMLNRVDYKGCCEKQELLDRVKRLWKNLKSMPAVEKLPTDELCKICMDAPIECVILECGHMATCTSCGKVLSECPICRQYIVRIVRFFRA